MGFNFGAFAGGFAKKFSERVEEEENRVNTLIDDTWDEYTRDKRERDAEYKTAKETAEETIKGLNAMGYDIPLAAHLANSGSIAVQHAMTIAEKYGGTHDLNTLFQFAPDASSKDFTTVDWVNSVAGKPEDINLSDYISPSMKTRTLFTAPAEEGFTEKVRESTADVSDDTTSAFTFGDLKYDAPDPTEKSLATLDAMLTKNFQKLQEARAANKSTEALIAEQDEILKLMKRKSGDGGSDSTFSKQSLGKVLESIRVNAYPSTAFKVDSLGQRILDLTGNDPQYLEGENRTITNAMNHPYYTEGDMHEPLFKNMVDNAARTVGGVNVAYVNTKVNEFVKGNVIDEGELEKRSEQLITQDPSDYYIFEELDRQSVLSKANKRAYADGAVIQYVDRSDPDNPFYGFVIWTGMSAIELTAKALTSYSHAGLSGMEEYKKILKDNYNR
jgi:hypothetical protein